MKVRRYTGSSLDKIRDVIEADFGEHAVIINTKKTSKAGILPGTGKASYEVIAAIDESVNADMITRSSGERADLKLLEDLMEGQQTQYRGLRKSMKRLDEKLADLDGRMDTMVNRNDPLQSADEMENVHSDWRDKMIPIVKEISNGRNQQPMDWLEALATLIPTAGGIMFRETPESPPDVYVMCGPTGVGKTTTLAKLTAKCVLGQNLNVGVLTIDTFRMAAVDQLREYASLLGVEMQVAFSPEELRRHLDNFADKDVVFIDTPGRSQFDQFGIDDIKKCVCQNNDMSVLLTIPANVRREDAKSIFDSYKVLNPVALIITKSDETTKCDGLTTLFDKSKLPVVYLTVGQHVPEDIQEATPAAVAGLIMPRANALTKEN